MKTHSFDSVNFSRFWVLCFFPVNCLGGWNQYMWLVSCRRQMLTQGHAPDTKRKLSISSFPTFPHLLDCLTCTRNVHFIIINDGIDRSGVVDLYQGMAWGTRAVYYCIVVVFCYLCFFLLLSHALCLFFKRLGHDSCSVEIIISTCPFVIPVHFVQLISWWSDLLTLITPNCETCE